ncbi:MAG: PRC-barrel domain containing protein [Anaerolineae bacterium]|nr:PRC-barrel domain containing protein [Anaerolineae bacterium]
MLRSVKELNGYTIQATDGRIGKVSGFYFDDAMWTIRYLVVDTGPWLFGRKVLITALALGQPDWASHLLPVGLTKELVESSPDIDLARPVSRQLEVKLHEHYDWQPYWWALAQGAVPPPSKVQKEVVRVAEGDPYLRSTQEVVGYHIAALDGEVGHVEDFIVDDETWAIQYMVVDTRNWLPGKKVLVAPAWIEKVEWAESKVYVDLHQETIKNSPEYNPSAPVNRAYEERLYDFYGRPKYW